jgi:hypothetical protein
MVKMQEPLVMKHIVRSWMTVGLLLGCGRASNTQREASTVAAVAEPGSMWRRLEAFAGRDGAGSFTREEEAGPLGTRILRVRAGTGGYPGANCWAALVDGSETFGALNGRGLADWVRHRGEAARGLGARDWVQLLRHVRYGGNLVVPEAAPLRVLATSPAIVIEFTELDPMSGSTLVMRATIPANGPETVTAAPSP